MSKPMVRKLAVVVLAFWMVSVAGPALADGKAKLVVHYTFDVIQGEFVRDASGTRNTGRLVRAAAVETPAGHGVRFDERQESYVRIQRLKNLNLTADLSFMAWVKLEVDPFPDPTTNWHLLMCGRTGASGFSFRVDGETGVLTYMSNGKGWSKGEHGTKTLKNGRFHHVALTRRGNKVTYFVDGQEDAQFTMPRPARPKLPLLISAESQPFGGTMDEVKMYRGALTPEEVLSEYNKGAATFVKEKQGRHRRSTRRMARLAAAGVVATADAPTIDGRLDEAAWRRAGKASGFVLLGGAGTAAEQTAVSLLYDDEHLFMGFRCAESQMDSLKGTARRRDTTDVCTDDSIEVFLIPPKNAFLEQFSARKRYFHIMLNVLGTQYDEVGPNGQSAWDAQWHAAVSRGEDCWEAEIAIPFSALSTASPAAGSVWTANFNRVETRLGEYSAWSTVYGSFHDPPSFGRMVFVRRQQEAQALEVTALRGGVLLPRAETTASELERTGKALRALKGAIAPVRETRERHRRATRQVAQLVKQVRSLPDARLVAARERIEGELDLLAKEAEVIGQKALLFRSYTDAELRGKAPRPACFVFVTPAITNEKLLPHRFPRDTEPGREISVFACRGEIEPATFSVYALQDLKDVRVTVGPMRLKGRRASPLPEVDVRIVKCWYQAGVGISDVSHKLLTPELLLKDDALVRVDSEKEENFLRTARADGREAYVPVSTKDSTHLADVAPRDADSLQPVDIPAKRLQQFWLTISVPPKAAPGEYRSTVHIQPAGLPGRDVPLIVKVLPFELEPSMLTYSIFYRGQLTHTGKGSISSEAKSAEQYLAEVKDMKAHGVLYPIVYQSYDEELLTQLLQLREKTGLPKGIFFGVGHGPGSASTQAELDTVASDVRKWRAFLAPFGYDQVYFYGIDEAKGDKLKAQRAAWRTVQEAGGKTFVACYRGTFERMGALLNLAILFGSPDPREAKEFHGVGSQVFSYGNPQVGVEEPETYRRNFGLLLWKAGFDGAMDYAYQHGFNHVWNDFDHKDYRDHNFAYPTVNGVVGTIQWEGFREGVDDVRYLATLLDAIARGKASGDKGKNDILAAEKYVEELRDTDLLKNDLDTIRRELARHILNLHNAPD